LGAKQEFMDVLLSLIIVDTTFVSLQ